ncbi:MAG: cysteine hydrolase family protein [Flavobacteriaceae bacterium]
MIALLLIDIQKGLDQSEHWGGSRNNPSAESNCREILDYFRSKNWPIFHIQHCSTNPESPLFPGKQGHDIKAEVAPLEGEKVITKNTNSAFVGTALHELLTVGGIESLVIVGLTTDHCVSATVRSSADLGFRPILVADATATYSKTGFDGSLYEAQLVHSISLASLKDEFALIINTSTLLDKLEVSGPASFI